eukprot:jgi/Mesen1/9559/ME000640S08905
MSARRHRTSDDQNIAAGAATNRRSSRSSKPSISPSVPDSITISPTAPPPRSKFSPSSNPFSSPGLKSPSTNPFNSPTNPFDRKPSLESRYDELALPLPPLEADLKEDDLKESAYELLLGAVGARLSVRSSVQAKANVALERANSATSRLKNAFGLRSKEVEQTVAATIATAVPTTPIEILQRQLEVSDFHDMRTRKALQRAAAGQTTSRADALVVPLELLYHLSPADFPSQHDFQHWKWRQLTLLEEGLIRLPGARGGGADAPPDASALPLKRILAQLQTGQVDLQDHDTKQSLRSAVIMKAERASRGGSGEGGGGYARHWADEYPLNVYLYEVLLRAVFDFHDPGSMVDGADDLLEVVRKAWPVLGMTASTHGAVFAWVLFRQFVVTGQKEVPLLFAAESQVKELAEELREGAREGGATAPRASRQHMELLRALLGTMQGYAEKRLLAYHQAFPDGAQGAMEHLVGIAVVAEEILQLDDVKGFKAKGGSGGGKGARADAKRDKAEQFIRSSVKGEFALVWDPAALKEHYGPSAVDVVRLLDETLAAFFALPLRPRPEALEELVAGMDKALQHYLERLLATTGPKEQFVPPLPPLTRFKKDVLSNAAPDSAARRATEGDAPKIENVTLPRLLVRLNTVHFILTESNGLAKRVRAGWETAFAPPPAQEPPRKAGFLSKAAPPPAPPPLPPPLPAELLHMFEGIQAACRRSMGALCQLAAYRVAFFDLRGVLIEGLYYGSVARARMSTVLAQLGTKLMAVVDIVSDKLRDQVVLALLKALLEAYLQVLLAPGPNRAYMLQDATLLEDDVAELKELFVDGGEGLPLAEVERACVPVEDILTLFSCPTEQLIASFERAYREALSSQGEKLSLHGKQGLSKLPTPKNGWSSADANTILRVLCYRGDRKGSKYLKKLFDMPKEVWKF